MTFVEEIQNERFFFATNFAIQSRKRLNRLDSIEPFVNVHSHQQRLIEPSLILVGNKQNLIVVGCEFLAKLRLADRVSVTIHVHLGLGVSR